MKRIFALLLAVLMLCLSLSLVACDSSDKDPDDTQHTHVFADATCKAPKTCSCGATDGEPLNAHTFENGVCKVCEKTLLQELRDLVYDEDTGKVKEDFILATDSGYINDLDVVSISAKISVDAPNSETDWYGIEIKLTQEAITSGIYEWSFSSNIYDNENDRYLPDILEGTLTAADFTKASTSALTVTDNFGNYGADGFDEAEVSQYLTVAAELLDGVIEAKLVPLFTLNESGLTIADLGFEQYK